MTENDVCFFLLEKFLHMSVRTELLSTSMDEFE